MITRREYTTAALAAFGVTLAMIAALRLEERIWWCACGQLLFWVGDPNSSHNSQHLFDPYSLTHLLHGVLFCGLFAKVAPQWSWPRRFVVAAALEALWEVWENSPFVINRYRAATIAVGYPGDSIVNSVGDMLSCLVGFYIAKQLGWMKSAALCIAAELLLLVTIRDNLTLNVLMLIFPIDAVKTWQAG